MNKKDYKIITYDEWPWPRRIVAKSQMKENLIRVWLFFPGAKHNELCIVIE